jgi:hypothetical protein
VPVVLIADVLAVVCVPEAADFFAVAGFLFSCCFDPVVASLLLLAFRFCFNFFCCVHYRCCWLL